MRGSGRRKSAKNSTLCGASTVASCSGGDGGGALSTGVLRWRQDAAGAAVLGQCQSIEKRLFGKADSWAGGLFEQELKKRTTRLLYVCSSGGQVVAYTVFSISSLSVQVGKLAVKDTHRRRGLGRQLLLNALKEGIASRRSVALLHVDIGNAPALGLYHALGFTQESMVEDYYGPGKHAFRMSCSLDIPENAQLFLPIDSMSRQLQDRSIDYGQHGCWRGQGRGHAVVQPASLTAVKHHTSSQRPQHAGQRYSEVISPLPRVPQGGGPPADDGSVLQTDILDFVRHMDATHREQQARSRALAKVQEAVAVVFPQAQVKLFGSLPAGMSVYDSDMDIVVLNLAMPSVSGFPKDVRPRIARMLDTISASMKRNRATYGRHLIIRAARIPIIKCKSSEGGLELDIAITDARSCEAAAWQHEMSQRWPALRPLVVTLKTFLKQRNLNDVSTGGLGSFALVNMVLAVLQSQPQERDLGTLFAAFLRLFGRDFSYQRQAVSVQRGGIVTKDSVLYNGFNEDMLQMTGHGSDIRMTVEDPLTKREVAGGSHAMHMVQASFSEALGVLETVSANGMANWDGSPLLSYLIDMRKAICRPGYYYRGPTKYRIPEPIDSNQVQREDIQEKYPRKRQAQEMEEPAPGGGLNQNKAGKTVSRAQKPEARLQQHGNADGGCSLIAQEMEEPVSGGGLNLNKAGKTVSRAQKPEARSQQHGNADGGCSLIAMQHQQQHDGHWATGQEAIEACSAAGAKKLARRVGAGQQAVPLFQQLLARKLKELPLKSGQNAV